MGIGIVIFFLQREGRIVMLTGSRSSGIAFKEYVVLYCYHKLVIRPLNFFYPKCSFYKILMVSTFLCF